MTGGALSNFTGAGRAYSATFTPTADSDATATININAGAFTDELGNENTAATPETITVDTTAPTVTVTSDKNSVGGNDGSAVETATITFTLSEPSTDFIASDVVVVNGTIGALSANGTNDVYTTTFTPDDPVNGTATVTVPAGALTDSNGNDNTEGQVSIEVNTIRPTVGIVSVPTSVGGTDVAVITFTLSADSIDFQDSDVVPDGGTISALAGSGSSYTAIFTPTGGSTAAGTVTVDSGRFTDADGNENLAASSLPITVDTEAPTVTISSDLSTLVIGETANITFALSEDSTTFTAADVLVTGGVLSNFVGAGKNYTATFTPTADTDATATININTGAFTDELGNQNIAATPETITVDTTAPTVTVTSDKNSVGGNTGSAVDEATITFTLSEDSADFVEADVVVVNGTLSNWNPVSATVYEATFTPDDPVNELRRSPYLLAHLLTQMATTIPKARCQSKSTPYDRQLELSLFLHQSVELTSLSLRLRCLLIQSTFKIQMWYQMVAQYRLLLVPGLHTPRSLRQPEAQLQPAPLRLTRGDLQMLMAMKTWLLHHYQSLLIPKHQQ